MRLHLRGLIIVVAIAAGLAQAQDMGGCYGSETVVMKLAEMWFKQDDQSPQALVLRTQVNPEDQEDEETPIADDDVCEEGEDCEEEEEEFDTTYLVKEDREIEGFIEGSNATRVLYLVFISVGIFLLTLTYPVIFFNENKYMNLCKIDEIIQDYLFESKDNKTVKENENRLIFTQGKLSFAQPAKDDLFGFESPQAIVMNRNVEIYQWARVINYKFYEDVNQDRYKYEKIWSQQIIDSEGFPVEYQNPQVPGMPCQSKVFFGDVKLGDFTLTAAQLEDVLEPEMEHPALSKEQIEQVILSPDSTYRRTLHQHGYSDFTVSQLEKHNRYQETQYILYSRKEQTRTSQISDVHNRRSSIRRRATKRLNTEEKKKMMDTQMLKQSTIVVGRAGFHTHADLQYDSPELFSLDSVDSNEGSNDHDGAAYSTDQTARDRFDNALKAAGGQVVASVEALKHKFEDIFQSQIGDIRVRYTMKTAESTTILAQQWNTMHGDTTFRPFNFWNVDAKPWESTMPTMAQLKRNLGFFKRIKSVIGGLTITYIDKAEAGTEFTIESLLTNKLRRQNIKVYKLRAVWALWMTLAFYGVCLPFTAEMAFIPLIGGLLEMFNSQSGVILVFASFLTLINYMLINAIIWIRFKPWVSGILFVIAVGLVLFISFCGTPLPVEYAKYKLGYF